MKRIIAALILFVSLTASGQGTLSFYHPNYRVGPSSANMWAGQFINLANGSNYVTQTAGAFTDTLTQATNYVKLSLADAGNTTVFKLWPIYQPGKMAVTINCRKISGTPDLTAVLQQSPDGQSWGPATINYTPVSSASTTGTVVTTIARTYPETFTMANTDSTQSLTWNLPILYTPYMRVALQTTTVTQSQTCNVKYLFRY